MSRKISRKHSLRNRSQQFAQAVNDRRQEDFVVARTIPSYAPGPWTDEVAHAFELGYRAAIADLRSAIRRDVPRPGEGTAMEARVVFKEVVNTFLRPMK